MRERVIVLDEQPAEDALVEAGIFVAKSSYRGIPVTVDPTDVNLDLRRLVKVQGIEDRGVVTELCDAPVDDIGVFGVDDDELVRMHGDPHPVLVDEMAECPELADEGLLPRGGADRMQCERDET